MRLLLITLFWLSVITPASIGVQVDATQRGITVEAHIVITFAGEVGEAHASVATDPDLTIVSSVMDGGTCTAARCQITLQGGVATVVMTTTAVMQSAGEHIIGVVVTIPGRPTADKAIAIETHYMNYLPFMCGGCT